jgi:hypothetical protein
MPFDEDKESEKELRKTGLKQVSSKKSIFDDMPKKQSLEDFQEKVKKVEESNLGYKKKAAELSVSFKKMILDKTLSQNRNVFIQESEQEVLANMIKLATEVNVDPNEQEGMGSLMWVILLLKTCLVQRDKINSLEYELFELKNKGITSIKSTILQEIRQELDKK